MQVVACGRWNRFCSNREETRKLHLLRNRYDSGRASEKELGTAQDEVTALLIKELETAGADILGDGMIRWDSVFDVARAINGCCGFDQLTRILKTNHFHRQPVVKLPLRRKQAILAQDLAFAKQCTKKPIAMCLPGPYSLSLQTQNLSEIGLEELACAYAAVLNEEINDLLGAGAKLVRIEEPHILDRPQDFKLFQEISARLLEGIDASRVAFAAWFGNLCMLPEYFDLPFGIFFVDFVEGRKSIEVLRYFPEKKRLIAGIVDARQTYRESLSELKNILSKILLYIPKDRLLLSAHTDLHFLPWEEAMLKVKKLVRFAHEYAKL